MRAKIIWTVIGIIILCIVGWVFNHSRLEVLIGESTTKTTVTIINQSNGKQDVIETDASSASKLVTRGGYSILVKQADKSYFTQVKAAGFFTKKNRCRYF